MSCLGKMPTDIKKGQEERVSVGAYAAENEAPWSTRRQYCRLRAGNNLATKAFCEISMIIHSQGEHFIITMRTECNKQHGG